MDAVKIGNIIRILRKEKGMTQQQLADQLYISPKAISKWERGVGCPDISLLVELATILQVDIMGMLQGELGSCDTVGGNMKKAKYYVCPLCHNVTVCTGNAEVLCCGRKLETLVAQKAKEAEKLQVEEIEGEWFITSTHPMRKDSYISFVAFATGDRMQLIKQYPEWDLQVRVPKRVGMLVWHSTTEGLFYQLLH